MSFDEKQLAALGRLARLSTSAALASELQRTLGLLDALQRAPVDGLPDGLDQVAAGPCHAPAEHHEVGVEHVDQRGEADAHQLRAPADGLAPLAHPHDASATLRADVVTASDRSDALLALAPDTTGGFYLVPRVIE